MRGAGSVRRTATVWLAAGVVVMLAARPGVEPIESEVQDRIGTIRAMLDGEQNTWYVLEGTVDGQAGRSALWMDMGDGTVNVIVGGYDRVDVPFDTFERDPETGMSRDGSETVRVTEGRFEVEGARPLEEVLPEGS